MKRLLIFSDLDGTLLDHDSYSFEAAIPALKRCQQDQIPIIATTSKTRAEVEGIIKQLNIKCPFIVENGAAIFVPQHYFSHALHRFKAQDPWQVLELAPPRHRLLAPLQALLTKWQHLATPFSAMSTEKIMTLTGLNADQAHLAKQREYGDPIHWQGSVIERQTFIKEAADYGVEIIAGGRFLHIAANFSKGKALLTLLACYQREFPDDEFITLALGDGGNDVSMIDAADIGVRIRSMNHPPPKVSRTRKLITSEQFGPSGWNDVVLHIIAEELA